MTSHAPKDAKVMAAILKDVGVTEYEPRVINQMLEFAYRHVTDILDDAKVYSDYAKKKQIDSEDIKLAVQFKVDHSLSNPPPKELMVEIAKEKNSQPLPPLKQQAGLRLPPDRYCLTQQNFRLKAGLQHTVVGPNLDFGENRPFVNGSGGLAGFKKRGSEQMTSFSSSSSPSLPIASSSSGAPIPQQSGARFTASSGPGSFGGTPQQQRVASPADSLAGTGAAGLAASLSTSQMSSGPRGNSPFDAAAAGSGQISATPGSLSTAAKPLFRLVAGTTEGGGAGGVAGPPGTPTTLSLSTSQSNQPGGNGGSSAIKRKFDQLDEDYDN